MRILALLFVSTLIPTQLFAQHDGARNSVQLIAKGKYDQAAKAIKNNKKPFAGVAESHFVEMLSLLAQDRVEDAFQLARKAVADGLPPERFLLGPKKELSKFRELTEFNQWIKGFNLSPVVAGPMIGRVTSNSASCWLRTDVPRKVTFKLVREEDDVAINRQISTIAASDNTGIVTFPNLKPNTKYRYEIAGTNLKGSIKTRVKEGSSGRFKVAFGGGAGFIPEWERMWNTIGSEKPDAMLMLGDNVYIDQPEYSLCQHYCYYRRQCRPEWKRFTANVPIYSIWDDHDFATNDCNTGPHIDKPNWKPKVWKVFTENWINPGYGGGESQPGCWYDFQIADVHFIMLDGRYYRHRDGKTMLGPVQKSWLKKTLRESKGTFKIVISPVPFTPGIKPGSKDPWDGFPEEREEIFGLIDEHRIPGVFLVAADRHRTDLRKIKRPNGYDLYEFMSSKLTNRHTHPVVKTEGLIWGYNKTCSFGLMEFDTTAKDPQVRMKCISIDGKLIHEHTLRRSSLE